MPSRLDFFATLAKNPTRLARVKSFSDRELIYLTEMAHSLLIGRIPLLASEYKRLQRDLESFEGIARQRTVANARREIKLHGELLAPFLRAVVVHLREK